MSSSLSLTSTLSSPSWPHLPLASLIPLLSKGLDRACSPLLPLVWDILRDIRTLYLFTKSDLKTILLPVTVFACMMAPDMSSVHLPRVIFWIWINLLQFCISNQCINPEEDAANKPWRPIPAGLITREQSVTLQKFLAIGSLLISYYWGVFPAGALICVSTIAYNDLGFHRDMVLRNACNAVGYASFELGATQLAVKGPLSQQTYFALVISASIVFTTIHAADFWDEKGDKLEGKVTLPIAFPEASRTCMLILLTWWSLFLSVYWDAGLVISFLLCGVGATVGVRFYFERDAAADRRSYLLYNIWLSLAHICIGLGQFRAGSMPLLRTPMLAALQ